MSATITTTQAPGAFMRDRLEQICRGESLSRQQSRSTFRQLIKGESNPVTIAALLTALKCKGEHPEEIAGAAEALLAAARAFPSQTEPCIDTCGTGGDGAQTVNLSTAVALLLPELGARVVKHGNRSVSSRCGSADVLERLGLALQLSPESAAQSLQQEGFCFLFAPSYHAGVRHVMGVRRGLAMRTIFNLLGPLVNPARPRYQLLGVYDPTLCRPLAETLRSMGTKRAMVVHGSGLDEIALHGPTQVAELSAEGQIIERLLQPEDFGLPACQLDELRGADPGDNARVLRQTLAGEGAEAHNHVIAANAAAALYLLGHCDDLRQGAQLALQTLAGGQAAARLERVVALHQRLADTHQHARPSLPLSTTETSHGPA